MRSEHLNILVIGLGSMGKRRIRLLLERPNVTIFGVDSNQERCKEVQDTLHVQCYESIDTAVSTQPIHAAMVCTSPLSHANIIHECLSKKMHVFTELNLVQDRYDENIALAKENRVVLFLSSTFLYRTEPEYIIDTVKQTEGKLNYNYHIGQYLPDWHPWESYNNYFIGNPRTNGCREIMAIELPWLVTCFGDIKSVQVLKSKNTNLNITYNDNYQLMIEHTNGTHGTLSVDVVARKAVRRFEVYGENLYLTWDGKPTTVNHFDIENKADRFVNFEDASEHREGYAEFVTENPYREEIAAFLDEIQGVHSAKWDFERDKEVLSIIDKIEA